MIRVLDILEDTMVDGPGFRTSIYCAGCKKDKNKNKKMQNKN